MVIGENTRPLQRRFLLNPSEGTIPLMCRISLMLLMTAAGFMAVGAQMDTVPQSAESYLMRGERFSDARQYDRAIEDYNAAIQRKPEYAEAYNDRGFAYYLKGDFAHAISDYTRAIELRPNYPRAYNSRGVAYMQGGYGAEKSVGDFDRAIELKPDFRYAYINRANARLPWHPELALQDFHLAGMHPERVVAIFAAIAAVIGLALIPAVSKRRRRAGLDRRTKEKDRPHRTPHQ
jgi:tetratricopeptide (TPR) repeat protein